MTDQEIFEGIARKDNQTFLFLYQEHQGQILRMVQKNSGNEADAHDIFQEGLVALWTNISRGKFVQKDNAKISTYLYTLCRNIWISRLRKRKNILSIDKRPHLEVAAEVDEMEAQYDQIAMLENQFAKLGDACRKILTLFYYQKAALKEIAELMQITEKTAKNTKYRCMQNLRTIYETETQGQ